jgi:glycosyltransferase involved in cell wall biosynthesis
MRIAQVAPLAESVPPKLYGGTERVVSYLTEELVRLGHEVTLFASGDSQTRARLIDEADDAYYRELRKSHRQELTPAGEVLDVAIAVVLQYQSLKSLPRQELHQLNSRSTT